MSLLFKTYKDIDGLFLYYSQEIFIKYFELRVCYYILMDSKVKINQCKIQNEQLICFELQVKLKINRINKL